MSEFIVEILDVGDIEESTTSESGYYVEVLDGPAVDVVDASSDPVIVEIIDAAAGDPAAYIEPMDFSRAGELSIMVGNIERPISGGVFSFASITARVSTAPTGAAIILDVLKNGTSIFETVGDRPTIPIGQKIATVGSWGNTTVTDGDYVTVDILQVGSTTAGSDLVVPIRLGKVA